MAEKRKASDFPRNSYKKSKEELTKDSGIFTEDQIPDGVFYLGDSVFVYTSKFKGFVLVHIRRYKKYGKMFYPTKEGVTLRPWWIQYLMGRSKVPETANDLEGTTIFLPADQFQMESSDFQNFTFTRITQADKRIYKSITITRDQWTQMITQYQAISTSVSDEFYRCMDFFTAYKKIYDLPVDSTLPSSLDVSLGQQYILDILQKSFCDYMISNGYLQEPELRAEELLGQREETFNNASFYLNVEDLVHCFYANLQEPQPFLVMSPHSYLTLNFLKNMCLKTVLQKSRKYFCPDNTSVYFENFM